MNRRTDFLRNMQRFDSNAAQYQPYELDEMTIDHLLDGSVAPEDTPAGYELVQHALNALRSPAAGTELAREADAVASIAAYLITDQASTPTRRRSSIGPMRKFAFAAAAGLVAGVSLFSGLAAANALPDAAQRVASDMLSKVGISVPTPNTHASTPPNRPGHDQPTTTPSTTTKGSDTPGLAHTTASTGVDKGAAISTQASDGQSQAGQHQTPATNPPPRTPPTSAPPASHSPNGPRTASSTSATEHTPPSTPAHPKP